MSYPRSAHFLFILLLALGLFGAAIGVAHAHGSDGEWLVAGEKAIAAIEDSGAVAPEREKLRPSADEVCKRRAREFSGPAARARTALAQTLKAIPWSGVAEAAAVDPFSLPFISALDAHACAHIDLRLQLKLQLGQAP